MNKFCSILGIIILGIFNICSGCSSCKGGVNGGGEGVSSNKKCKSMKGKKPKSENNNGKKKKDKKGEEEDEEKGGEEHEGEGGGEGEGEHEGDGEGGGEEKDKEEGEEKAGGEEKGKEEAGGGGEVKKKLLEAYKTDLINKISIYLDVHDDKKVYANRRADSGDKLTINVGEDEQGRIKISCGILTAVSVKTIDDMMSENIGGNNVKSIEFILTAEVSWNKYIIVNTNSLEVILNSLKSSNNTIGKYDGSSHYLAVSCNEGSDSLEKGTKCYIDLRDGALFESFNKYYIISHAYKDLGFDIINKKVYKLFYLKNGNFSKKGNVQKEDVKLYQWVPNDEFLVAHVFTVAVK